MTFGYARVSTKTQARDGNSLDAQQAALTAAGTERSSGAVGVLRSAAPDSRGGGDGGERLGDL